MVKGVRIGTVIIMCLNIGTPTIINFPFVPNGKLIIVGAPNLRNITIGHYNSQKWKNRS